MMGKRSFRRSHEWPTWAVALNVGGLAARILFGGKLNDVYDHPALYTAGQQTGAVVIDALLAAGTLWCVWYAFWPIRHQG